MTTYTLGCKWRSYCRLRIILSYRNVHHYNMALAQPTEKQTTEKSMSSYLLNYTKFTYLDTSQISTVHKCGPGLWHVECPVPLRRLNRHLKGLKHNVLSKSFKRLLSWIKRKVKITSWSSDSIICLYLRAQFTRYLLRRFPWCSSKWGSKLKRTAAVEEWQYMVIIKQTLENLTSHIKYIFKGS